MEILGRIRRLIPAALVLMFFLISFFAVLYQRYFRYDEISSMKRSDGSIVALLRDELISGDMSYDDCGCYDESYFVLKLDDKIVYKFYVDVSPDVPNYFKIVDVDSDNIFLRSRKCFVFKVPYNRVQIDKSHLIFFNNSCSKEDFKYYSGEYIKDYELNYYLFPSVK